MDNMATAEYTSVPSLSYRLYAPFSKALSHVAQQKWAFLLLLLPPLLFLIMFFIVPMALFLREGFVAVDPHSAARTLSFGNYVHFLGSPDYLKVLWNTLRLGVIVTFLCLLLGYPLAYAMARFGPRWQRWILVAVISPLMVSVVIRTFAWQVILRNRGPLNDFLIATGITDSPLRLLFTFTGVVIGLVHVFLPYMVLPLASVIEKMDPRLEEAARSLGANVFRRFFEVVLPLSMPGILAGSMLVFTASVSAYVVPELLGGERVQVVPTMVTQQILILLDWQFGAAMATILIMLTLLVLLLYRWLSRHSFQAGK
jgi:putative spermidine/putrescine transport system permease protein